jgi:hypothetical protein
MIDIFKSFYDIWLSGQFCYDQSYFPHTCVLGISNCNLSDDVSKYVVPHLIFSPLTTINLKSIVAAFIDIGATEITHRHPHQPQTIAKMPAADVGASMEDIRRIHGNINVGDKKKFCEKHGMKWSASTIYRFFKSLKTKTKGGLSVSGWQLVVQCCSDIDLLHQNEHDTVLQGVVNYCNEHTEYDSEIVEDFVNAADHPSPPSLANGPFHLTYDLEGDRQENEEYLRTDITVSPSGLHNQENVCLDEYPSSVQVQDNLPYLNIRRVGTIEHAGGSVEGQWQPFDDDGKPPTINPTAGRATLFGTSSNKQRKTPTFSYTPAASPSTNTSSALSASKQKTASAASSDQPRSVMMKWDEQDVGNETKHIMKRD